LRILYCNADVGFWCHEYVFSQLSQGKTAIPQRRLI
jgi:hypothetical protein